MQARKAALQGRPQLSAMCAMLVIRRTFYKYKGRGRDAPSILKFLNMVCNQSSDQVSCVHARLSHMHTHTGMHSIPMRKVPLSEACTVYVACMSRSQQGAAAHLRSHCVAHSVG